MIPKADGYKQTAELNPRDRQAVTRFLNTITAERGAAENTIAAYERDLVIWAGTLPSGADLLTAGVEDLRHVLGRWSGDLSARTVSRRLSALHQFMVFAVAEDLRRDDPTSRLDRPKTPAKLPKSLSEDEVARLFAAATCIEGAAGKRLVCMLEILYATGLRVSEMIALPIAALRRGQNRITITGKGGRERLIILTDAAHAAIDAWLEMRDADPESVTSPWLFPAADGYIKRQQVNTELARLALDAGIGKTVSPHMLRHSFATHMLNRGADLRSLQLLLGHANIATTEIYTKTRDDRLAGLVRDIHPLARKD